MNEPDTLPSAAARLAVRGYLQNLPEAPFAAGLSQRLQARTRAELARSRRFSRTLRVASAAALALALLVPGWRLSQVPPAPNGSAPVPGAATALAQVQALDRELQAAIQRGDSAAQLAALWAERNAVIAQLSSSTPAHPARI